jgi:hypothetical protein
MARTYRTIPELSAKDLARFWAFVDKRGPDDCWPWTGHVDVRAHYGRFTLYHLGRQLTLTASRIALILASGVQYPEREAAHDCDNPPCCNGRHLFWATHAVNSADMVIKGRSATGLRSPMYAHPECRPKGEKHGQAKLTDEIVLALRAAYTGQFGFLSEKARDHHVTPALIGHIVKNRAWKHLL